MSKKPELFKTKKDPELFYYFNAKKEKMFMYRLRYYDSLGKRREKSKQGFISENEAYRELLEVKSSILNGEVKQVENSDITVSEWLDIWFDVNQSDWSVRTVIQRRNAIKNQMKPLLGRFKLRKLNKSAYRSKYINVLKKNYAPHTVLLFHNLFKIAVNAAVEDEILDRNRFSKITVNVDHKSDNFLNPTELNCFLQVSKRVLTETKHTWIFTLAYTGLRRGEALGLKWLDIDFELNTLTVRRTRDNDGTRSPKTKRSYRTIPIDDELIRQLEKYRTWCKQLKLSFGQHLTDEDFIFLSKKTGQPISNNLHDDFEKVLDQSGVKRITPHGLRHTHATILITKRPINEVADRLGNTPEMIHRVYGHLIEGYKRKSVEAFSDSLKEAGGEIGGGF